jgi:hypothetical protein
MRPRKIPAYVLIRNSIAEISISETSVTPALRSTVTNNHLPFDQSWSALARRFDAMLEWCRYWRLIKAASNEHIAIGLRDDPSPIREEICAKKT